MELHDAEEAIGMREILAHDMRMKKNPQTQEGTFWIFTDFHEVMRVQSTDMELRDAEEAIGMKKILAHDMRMKKNPQTKENTFLIFADFHGVMRSKVQLAPLHGNFINWRH